MRFFPVFFFFPQSTHVKATWDASKQRQQPQKKLYTNNFFSLLLLLSQIDFFTLFYYRFFLFFTYALLYFCTLYECGSCVCVHCLLVKNKPKTSFVLTHSYIRGTKPVFRNKKKIILHLHFERAFAVFFILFSSCFAVSYRATKIHVCGSCICGLKDLIAAFFFREPFATSF